MYKKIIILIFGALLLNGCATMGKKTRAAEIARGRETPVYLLHGESAAAFKVNAVLREVAIEGLLLIKKLPDNGYNARILGPMGARIADLDIHGDVFTYKYLLPDFDSGMIKTRVEKFLMMMLYMPGAPEKVSARKSGLIEVKRVFRSGASVYSYQYDNAYPHAVSNGSAHIDYSDYRPYGAGGADALPWALTARDTLANVTMELQLLNIQ
jgi:hypothetical protein